MDEHELEVVKQTMVILPFLLYDTDKLAYERFCRWCGLPIPDPESVFCEQPDTARVVRDLSTVEELEQALALSREVSPLQDEKDAIRVNQKALGSWANLNADVMCPAGEAVSRWPVRDQRCQTAFSGA